MNQQSQMSISTTYTKKQKEIWIHPGHQDIDKIKWTRKGT